MSLAITFNPLEGTFDFVGSELDIKTGIVAAVDFAGSPKKAAVVFANPFTVPYTVTFSGVDARTITPESKTGNGFTINLNASTAPLGEVYWQAIATGEA